jgi:hypothetical protein
MVIRTHPLQRYHSRGFRIGQSADMAPGGCCEDPKGDDGTAGAIPSVVGPPLVSGPRAPVTRVSLAVCGSSDGSQRSGQAKGKSQSIPLFCLHFQSGHGIT